MQEVSVTDSYPLRWPDGWPRAKGRAPSRFKVSILQAAVELRDELHRMGADNIVFSSNLVSRRDGLPAASQNRVADPGVAVYFRMRLPQGPRNLVLACDRYEQPCDNVRALGLTISSMRAIERYGVGGVMERAFDGFHALPPGGAP